MSEDPAPATEDAHRTMLLENARAMLAFALRRGLQIPEGVVGVTREDALLEELVDAHNRLAEAVAPATPAGIRLLEAELASSPLGRALGPTLFVRRLTTVAVAVLIVFVVLAIVTTGVEAEKFNGQGLWPAVGTLYLASSAALGALFAALFQVQRRLMTATFEPGQEPSYWALILLGVIAGLLLSIVLPSVISGEVPGGDGTADEDALIALEPVLALVGGFSARAVHHILERLVDAVIALFGTADAGRDRPPAGP